MSDSGYPDKMIVPDRLIDLWLENCCEKGGRMFNGTEFFLTIGFSAQKAYQNRNGQP
jgi:hypothetical protein